ncbi:hypothetical protein KR067_003137, partial [Drosophila pandora]
FEFMEEYESLCHMSPAGNDVLASPHYVIPHQCVLRPQSTTTKLRVVFDASCKTSTQKCLNDLLMVGPIQEELYSTLLRFRLNKLALIADIKKMYRQVMDFYVDDLISGAPTKTEALEIIAQTSSLLNKGQFQLRKWCSNVPEVLEGVPESDRESY